MFGTNTPRNYRDYEDLTANTLLVTSVFATLQGEGPFAGRPAIFIRLTGCNLQCSFCFVGSTPIRMGDGTEKRIDEIHVGDEVLSWDGEGFVVKPVIRIYASPAKELVRVEAGTKRVWCTPDHPFLVSGRGYVAARDLRRDDVLVSFNSADYVCIPVQSIPMLRKTSETVHNLEVADTHTYIANGMVTHNCDTYFDRGDPMTFNALNLAIESITRKQFPYSRINEDNNGTPAPMIVVTGGEPLLQANLPAFLRQREQNEIVQVETAGSLNLPFPSYVYIVVSPKINERNDHPIKVHPDLLLQARALKFVISQDMKGYQDIPGWALDWRDRYPYIRHIYLSPMNMYANKPEVPDFNATPAERAQRERISFWTPGLLDMAANQRNHEYAAHLAMKYSCILSLQQHLYAGLP